MNSLTNYTKRAREYINLYSHHEQNDSVSFERLINSPEVMKLCSYPKGFKVLDIGCGTGDFTHQLQKKFDFVEASEGSPALAKYSSEKLKISVYNFDLEHDFPVLATKFNLVVCKLVLMYIHDLDHFIVETKKLLAPNGRLVISVTHPTYAVDKGLIANYFTTTPYQQSISSNRKLSFNYYHRTLAEYVNTFSKQGFLLEKLCEPKVPDSFVKSHPRYEYKRKFPLRLNMRFVLKT